ncbi:MAG: DUF4134 domain-containing protein [Paludibacteraceae bacterium]|nr:DUF4134 domain-containing protein [Paludibacteraceae bacterium]
MSRKKNEVNVIKMKNVKHPLAAALMWMSSAACAFAAGNGVSALEKANSEIKSYVEPITSLFYVLCAVVGFIGAVKVYAKWSSGSPDTTKTAASWFGACVFAVVAVTAIRAFFLD